MRMQEDRFSDIEINTGANAGWKGEAIICKGMAWNSDSEYAIKADRKPFPDGTTWYGDSEYTEIRMIKAV